MRVKSLYFFAVLLTTFISVNVIAQDNQDKNAVGTVGPIKFSGLMFGDLFYNADAIDQSKKDINGWQFRRIYFTVDYTISDNFSSRFRLEADQAALSTNNKIIPFVKDAWLRWKNIFSGSDLIAGISPTPAFEVSETMWGYRSLEKTIMDYYGIVSSRDLGIDLKGKLDEKGILNYWIKLGDNTGNSPETNKYKRYYASFQIKPSDNFLVTLYGDFASYPKKYDAFDNEMKDNSAIVTAGFINYKQGNSFSLGLEGFFRNQQNNYTPNANTFALESQSGFGLSVWGRAMLTEMIGLVGRYDYYEPNTNSAAENDVQGLIIGAVDFKVVKNVSVMPGIEVHTLQNDDNSDVTPRVTFFWEF